MRPGLLVTDDDRDGADEPVAIVGDERRGNGTRPETLLHQAGEETERVPLVLPEGAPDPIRDRLGKVRPVAKIADRDAAQRRVSSRRVMSFWRGAMEEMRPYSWSV